MADGAYLAWIRNAEDGSVYIKLDDIRTLLRNTDDLAWPATGLNPAGFASPATVDAESGFLDFANNAENTASASGTQLPHSWVEGTVVEAHVHWVKKAAGSGNVLWQLQYSFARIGETFPALQTLRSSTATVADPGTGDHHLVTSFGEIAMTGKGISTCAKIIIKRIGGDAADSYSNVAQLVSFDLHILKDSLGSNLRWSKTATT
jgi:hypothetical protein